MTDSASAPPPPRLRSLQALGPVRERLQENARLRAAREAAAREAERRAEAERHWFAHAVGPVLPLRTAERALLRPAPPLPVAAQLQRDEQAVLAEALSDSFDAASLLDTDDSLSWRHPRLGLDVLARLRRGEWSLQREIDLHGLRSEQAREALSAFIQQAHAHGLRCVRVVHGKGLGSPGKTPVLKSRVLGWLMQKREVLAFVQARPVDGGAGALLVLLAPHRPPRRPPTATPTLGPR